MGKSFIWDGEKAVEQEEPTLIWDGTKAVPVKKKASIEESVIGLSKIFPSTIKTLLTGGRKSESETPSTLKQPLPKIEDYNKQFEDVTGHRKFSLSEPMQPKSLLAQEGYKKRKENFELKKYEEYRDIEENEIKPVQTKVMVGEVKPSELSELYNKPYGKKIVGEIINQQVPELGSTALEDDTFGAEQKWKNIAQAINVKNIQQGIDLTNQMYFNLDAELNSDIKNLQTSVTVPGSQYGGGGMINVPLPEVDTNSPEQLGQLLQAINSSSGIVDKDGISVNDGKRVLAEKVRTKLELLKTQQPIHPEINSADITSAIEKANSRFSKGRNLLQEGKAGLIEQQFKLGLNYVKDADPALYSNVMMTIKDMNDVPDRDYEAIASIGQDIYNKQIYFQSGSNPELVGAQSDIKYTSYQSERERYSRILSETIKSLGYGNKGRVPTKAIQEAWRLNPELDDAEIVNDIAKDEAATGGGIVKSGWLNKRMNAIAEPFKDLNRFVNTQFIDSPAESYYNSRRLDYGDQKVLDAAGNELDRLPSDKYGTFDKILDGAVQIASQIAITKGVGYGLKAPISFGLRSVPRAALTANQGKNIVNIGGTFTSTYAQTVGNDYIDFLEKTGDPDKAQLMAVISGLGTAAIESFVAPDVKIADKAAELLKSKKGTLVKDLMEVIKNKGGKVAAGQVVKKFIAESSGIMGGQILQEDLQQAENFLVEGIFSPKTVEKRDLADEILTTTKETALATVIPAILGGGGATKAQRKLSKEGLHTIAINFNSYKEAMDKALANGVLSQDDYNLASGIIQQHKLNIDNAPKRDAKGELISAERQLEYAFQTTVEQIYSGKAAQQTDKVQREPFEEKIKEAEDIKRKIFNGEQVKDLPKDEDTKPDDKVAEENRLLEIADQALNRVAGTIGEGENAIKISDEVSLKRAVETFGEKDVKAAINLTMQKELEANHAELDAIENPTEGDIEYYKETENEIKQKYQAITEQISQPIELSTESEVVGSGVEINVADGFKEAGEKARDTKDATHIGRWMLDNSQKGDVVRFQDGGYEVTEVNTKKDGTKELVLTPFEFNEDGSKDYNNTGIKIITEQSIKNGSNLFENAYTNSKGERVIEQSTYEPAKQPTPTQEAVGELPPTPPEPPKEEKPESGDKGLNDKGVLSHLYNAKNVPEASKEGFKREGLKYETKSQQEAEAVAKGIIEEMGLDGALAAAEAMKFDGDVNSLIFGIALNRLAEENNAEKFAEVGIVYDKMARYGGRFNAAINYFYKKSPLGIVLMENAKRKEDFDQFAKGKEQSWKEAMQDPEFLAMVDKKVQEELKKERVSARGKRIEKVRGIFKKAKEKFRAEGGGTYGTIIPPHIIETVLETMELAYESGEAVAKIISDAVKSISQKLGNEDWDKEKFTKEWEEKLKDSNIKPVLSEEDLRAKKLDKIRKKLKGLTDKQKDKVIQRVANEIIENGGLEYEDLRKIIAEAVGKRDLTEDEIVKMKALVEKTNNVEKAADKVRSERTEESFKAFREAQKEAGMAQKELNELFYNKPDIIKRLTSIMVLGTLGPVSLVANVTYNIWNQATLRFPIGVVNTLVDMGITRAAKLGGKNIEQQYNVIDGQAEFWSKLGLGTKEAFEQVATGLNRMDYTQKEVYGQQIRPLRSLRELFANARGKKTLTRTQWWDKLIQGTVGFYSEAVARALNIGDKPLRFAAEGSQAAAFAKNLGLKGMGYELFIAFPREEAYRTYIAQGLSEEEAGKKADIIKEAIVKEGQRSTFQQDNMLNDALMRLFGGKDSGVGGLTKALVISPYVKIPTNAFWSFYNLVNPEVAIIQAGVFGAKAKKLKGQGEDVKAKLAEREARYWMGHAIVGMGMRAVVLSLVEAGVFTPATDEDDSKKERDAISFYDRAGTTEIKGVKISNKWFAQWGMMGNAIARKYKDMTPEQKEAQRTFWETIFGGMEVDALSELENGVFANSSSLLEAYSTGQPDRYLMNTVNLLSNIIQPAGIAQLNRAAIDNVTSTKGDNFLEKLNQNFAQRSTIYRRLFDVPLQYKRDIWGQKIPKDGNILSRMFGISKENPQLFARPVYDDYLRTMDSGFLPPAVLPILNGKKLNTEQHNRLQDYIGAERKSLIEPYINDASSINGFDVKYSQLGSDERKKYVLDVWYDIGRVQGLKRFYKDYPEFIPQEKPVDYLEDVQKDLFKTLTSLQVQYKK